MLYLGSYTSEISGGLYSSCGVEVLSLILLQSEGFGGVEEPGSGSGSCAGCGCGCGCGCSCGWSLDEATSEATVVLDENIFGAVLVDGTVSVDGACLETAKFLVTDSSDESSKRSVNKKRGSSDPS